MSCYITKPTSYDFSGKLIYHKIGMHNRSGSLQIGKQRYSHRKGRNLNKDILEIHKAYVVIICIDIVQAMNTAKVIFRHVFRCNIVRDV
jgi:hypothetical protein